MSIQPDRAFGFLQPAGIDAGDGGDLDFELDPSDRRLLWRIVVGLVFLAGGLALYRIGAPTEARAAVPVQVESSAPGVSASSGSPAAVGTASDTALTSPR